MLRAPGKQPGFHVFVANVMAGLELPVREPELGVQAFLVAEIGFHGIGDEKICAAARSFGELGQAFFGGALQANAEGGIFCVGHEHIVAWIKERMREQ